MGFEPARDSHATDPAARDVAQRIGRSVTPNVPVHHEETVAGNQRILQERSESLFGCSVILHCFASQRGAQPVLLIGCF